MVWGIAKDGSAFDLQYRDRVERLAMQNRVRR